MAPAAYRDDWGTDIQIGLRIRESALSALVGEMDTGRRNEGGPPQPMNPGASQAGLQR